MNISLCTLAALTSTAVKSTVTVLGISDRAIQYPTRGNTFYFQEESHFYNNVKQLKKKNTKKPELLVALLREIKLQNLTLFVTCFLI